MTQNDTEEHKLVDIEEADGLLDLDYQNDRGDTGDPFPGSTSNTTFNDSSNPNSKNYGSASTGVAVTAIASVGSGVMSANVAPGVGSTGDNIGYDERGISGSGRGYSLTTYWTAIRYTNSTSMDTLDGVDIYLVDTGVTSYVVDFYLYNSIPSGTPTTLLHSRTGFTGVPGWNRFLLSTQQPFPASSDRVIVLKVVGTGGNAWARYDSAGAVSGRCYLDSDGAGAFSSFTYGDFNQKALLSQSAPAPPPVPDGTTARAAMKASKLSANGNSIRLTWDTSCSGALNYSIVYGGGSQLPATFSGTYNLSGSQCAIGTSSPYTWNNTLNPTAEAKKFYWWLLVANGGTTEGSWGRNTGNLERTGPGAQGSSGICGTSKSLSNTCP